MFHFENSLHNIYFMDYDFFFLFSIVDALIQRLSIQRVLDVSSEWTEDSYESDYSSMQYDFRVTCDAHYYGTGCANLCRPRDDQFGHYTCSSTGSIVCLAGWQGDYCTKGKSQCFSFSSFFFAHRNEKIKSLNYKHVQRKSYKIPTSICHICTVQTQYKSTWLCKICYFFYSF